MHENEMKVNGDNVFQYNGDEFNIFRPFPSPFRINGNVSVRFGIVRVVGGGLEMTKCGDMG